MTSPKEEIETWVAALEAYDGNDFDAALKRFTVISHSAKIRFNMGVIHATLGEHAQAVADYQLAVGRDQYLAVAYFQQGVSNFLLGDFEEALANFNDTLLYLRGNRYIDYHQLGLKFKLHSCEVLFNRGLCYIYLQQKDAGMQDLVYASKEKAVPDHDVIDEAIKEEAEGYTVFSIPVGIIYRPNEAKVKNLKSKHYMSRPRVVVDQRQDAWERRSADHGERPHSADRRRVAALAALHIDDRGPENLSYAAKNLVRPHLQSRSRLQSEPPMNRDIFPPTPPPEPDRSESTATRRRTAEESVAPAQPRQVTRPPRLELGRAAFDQSSQQQQQSQPRLGTKRSESERPAMRRELSGTSSRNSEQQRLSHRSNREVRPDSIEAYSAETQRHTKSSLHLLPISISEEDEENEARHSSNHYGRRPSNANTPSSYEYEESRNSGSEGDTLSPLAFEIIPPHRRRNSSRSHTSSRSVAAPPPPPKIKTLRIKVHSEEVRYIMAAVDVEFAALVAQIGIKLSLAGAFKLKIRDDDGDMVTLGDQDDLDLAISTCAAAAARDRVDLGKLEVWIQEV